MAGADGDWRHQHRIVCCSHLNCNNLHRVTTRLSMCAPVGSCAHRRRAQVPKSTEGNEKVTLEQSLELVNEEQVVAIVGPQSSANAEIASLVASLTETPVISYGATAAALSDKEKHDYFFRTVPSDSAQGRAMVALVDDLNYKKVFVLHTGKFLFFCFSFSGFFSFV